MFHRYAVYLTPPPGPLAEFGASWLGWDLVRGTACRHPSLPDLDVAAITERPRRYGFHGTIKPPFRLADGTDAAALGRALARFCAQRSAIALPGLRLAALGRFLALVPEGDQSPLADLAGNAVQALDRFRGPQTEAELAARRAAGLNPAEEANLLKWGYPYVFDCFRFHMTLTGPLEPAMLERVQAALEPVVAPLLPRPFRIESLTLCGQDADGQFHQIDRFALVRGAGTGSDESH